MTGGVPSRAASTVGRWPSRYADRGARTRAPDPTRRSSVRRGVRVVAACAFMGWAVALPGQRTSPGDLLRGSVRDAATGAPVEGALVQAVAGADTVRRLTGRAGTFTLPRGTRGWSLSVRRLGFTPLAREVAPGATAVDVTLVPVPVALGAVRVEAPALPPRRCLDFASDPAADADAQALAETFQRTVAFLEEFKTEIVVRDRVDTLFSNGTYTESPETARALDSVFVRYERGGVLSGRATSLVIALPSVSNLAEAAFVVNHCWRRAGPDAGSPSGDSVEVLDLSPVTSITAPDVRGRVARDRSTGLPRWLALSVTRVDPFTFGVLDVRGELTFDQPVPFLATPATLRVTVRPRASRVQSWTLFRRFEYSDASLDAMFGTAP